MNTNLLRWNDYNFSGYWSIDNMYEIEYQQNVHHCFGETYHWPNLGLHPGIIGLLV